MYNYPMAPLSMTLSDLWPRFQGHSTFFDIEYLRNDTREPYTILHQWEVVYALCRMVIFPMTLMDT